MDKSLEQKIQEYKKKHMRLIREKQLLCDREQKIKSQINSICNAQYDMVDPVGDIDCYEYLLNDELKGQLGFLGDVANIVMDYANERRVYVVNGVVKDEDVEMLTDSFRYTLKKIYPDPILYTCAPLNRCGEGGFLTNRTLCKGCLKDKYWTEIRQNANHLQYFEDFDEGIDIYFPNEESIHFEIWGNKIMKSEIQFNFPDNGYNCRENHVCICEDSEIRFDWEEDYYPMIYMLYPMYGKEFELRLPENKSTNINIKKYGVDL